MDFEKRIKQIKEEIANYNQIMQQKQQMMEQLQAQMTNIGKALLMKQGALDELDQMDRPHKGKEEQEEEEKAEKDSENDAESKLYGVENQHGKRR